jgi:Protein of unknown function (DUF423)
MGLKHPLTLWN